MSTRKKKPDTLATRLRRARILLREWRYTVWDSGRNRVPGPDDLGKVDEATAHELARFDAACSALTEAIRLAKDTEGMPPMVGARLTRRPC